MGLPARTDAELQGAIESMLRIRAVESPPDDAAGRTIWHRGAKGADLVTYVDPLGRIARQELTLFADYLVWDPKDQLRTGTSTATDSGGKPQPSPYTVEFDSDQSPDRGHRISRAWRGVQKYKGTDKYLLHLRDLIETGVRGGRAEIGEAVTRAGRALRLDEAPAQATAPSTGASKILMIAIPAGLALAALAWWFSQH